MNTRPFVAGLFVLCCLLLCGLILRRQIAAHPLLPDISRVQEFHPANSALTRQVQKTIGGQVAALNAGDDRKAFSYQSRARRQRFADPGAFLQRVNARFPELGQSRQVHYGPVWADKSGTRAQERVSVEGKNGRGVQGVFQLVREDGELKVDSFLPIGGFGDEHGMSQQR